MKTRIKKRPRRKLLQSSLLPIFIASVGIIIVSIYLWTSLKSPVHSSNYLLINVVNGDVIEAHDENNVHSSNYLLINVVSGDVIEAHDENKKVYPASLTKIMTALLAIEHTNDFSEVITVQEEIYDKIYKTGASVAGFEPGELATLEELLYGIMLPSGAECCLTYANHIAGSETAFVVLMNQRARELGMNDTHFTNCTGLHSADHYTTAQDLAILLRYALNDETFRTVLTSQEFYVTPSAVHSDGFYLHSTLMEAWNRCETPLPPKIQILGGKTGYTSAAGLCLASLARIDGEEYILITLGAEGTPDSEPLHVIDAITLYSELIG